MYYLEDEDQARQLVELGYRGSGDTLSREEFEAQKKMLRERNVQKVYIDDFSSVLAVTQIEAYFDVSILPFPDPWVFRLGPQPGSCETGTIFCRKGPFFITSIAGDLQPGVLRQFKR